MEEGRDIVLGGRPPLTPKEDVLLRRYIEDPTSTYSSIAASLGVTVQRVGQLTASLERKGYLVLVPPQRIVVEEML